MKKSILEMELTDKQFSALSNNTRRTILRVIYDTPMCPRSISEQTGSSIASLKRHLRILLECNLILLSL